MELVNLRERGGLAAPAAAWLHDRWGIPARSYRESMDACLAGVGALLAHACADMARLGCPTLYLVTEHTSFYERYGWQFLCMVPEADSPCLLRMYRHRI